MKRALGSWAGVLGLMFASRGAVAQPSPPNRVARPPGPAANAPRALSLEGHLALAVAERLLDSEDIRDRVRGIDRLAASGQREAIDRLVRALADGGSVMRDPKARLAAVRGLFPYASREPVRQMMERALASESGGNALLDLVRETAAMALAASDDARSLAVLRAALRQGGAAAETAGRALLAYPPVSLAPLGVGIADLPDAVSDVLGRLGDQRAVGALRSTLVHGLERGDASPSDESEVSVADQSKRARVAAALALARLGDQEQVAVARGWMESGDADLKLRAAEILLQSGASDASRRLEPLLSGPEPTRTAAFRLALLAPKADVLPAAVEAASRDDDAGQIAASLLGRLGGPTAVARLERLLTDPSRAWAAAFALAHAPGVEARRALESAASNRALARIAARAGVVRALVQDDAPRGLGDLLRSLFASSDPADRAAAAFGLAALAEAPLADLVFSRDVAVVRAAARAALVIGSRATRVLASRLAVEGDPVTRTALGIALVGAASDLDVLPTYLLRAWAESDEPIAPLAVAALGSREAPGEERQLGRWMESDDPAVRIHAAFALGTSPLPNATGRLAAGWTFEVDPAVRRAIVASLAQRTEPGRLGALELAAKLDPDAAVREMAALGLRGRLPLPRQRLGGGCDPSGPRLGGCNVAWIALVPSDAVSGSAAAGRTGTLADASGFSLPVVTDPDGALVVPGVSAGNASFRLASSVHWYEAQGHDRGQTGPAR